MSTPKILNPFGNDTSQLSRVQSWVDPHVVARIRSVCPLRGIETCAVASVYKGLNDLLVSLNLTYTPENASFVSDFVLALPTLIQTAGERHYANVKDGARDARPAAKTASHKSADNGKGSTGGRGNRGRSGGK